MNLAINDQSSDPLPILDQEPRRERSSRLSDPPVGSAALEAEVMQCLAEPHRIASYPQGFSFEQAKKPEPSSTVRDLSADLSKAVQITQRVTAQSFTKKHGFLSRLLGEQLLYRIRILRDIQDVAIISKKISSSQEICQQTLQALDESRSQALQDVALLRQSVDIAIQYLERHPEAGIASDPTEISPRDRLARRISQLEILHATFRIAAEELQIARSQVLDVSERAQEFLQFLYPTWLRSLDLSTDEIIDSLRLCISIKNNLEAENRKRPKEEEVNEPITASGEENE